MIRFVLKKDKKTRNLDGGSMKNARGLTFSGKKCKINVKSTGKARDFLSSDCEPPIRKGELNMKKTMALLIAFSLMLGALAGCGDAPEPGPKAATRVALDSALIREPVPAATEFAGGTGTAEDPYQIATPGQLALMIRQIDHVETDNRDHMASFVLTADIHLNDTANWENWDSEAPDHQWYPNEKRAFSGTFDGNGHTIYGLYCYGPVHSSDAPDSMGLGLFNSVSGGEIRNLTIRESLIHGMDSAKAGMIAATATDTVIANCVNEGRVYAPLSLGCGGIVGKITGTVKDCSNRGEVCGQGGIAGVCFGSMYACRNEGEIRYEDGSADVGGIAGGFYGGADGSTAVGCLNTGSVSGGSDQSRAGGIFGSVYAGKQLVRLEDCRNTGTVSAVNEAGGIVGMISSLTDAVSSVTVSCAVNEGAVISGGCLGGICSSIHAHDSGAVSILDSTNRGGLNEGVTEGSIVSGGIVGSMTLTGHAQILLEGCVNESDLSTRAAGIGGIVSLITAYTEPDKHTEIRISDCRNEGAITGTAYGMGGIAGLVTLLEWTQGNLMEMTGCVNNGSIRQLAQGETSYLGGIAGNFMATAQPDTIVVSGCRNSGNILYDAAGLEMPEEGEGISRSFGHGIVAGYHENGLLTDCENTGTVQVVNGDSRWLIPETQYKNPELSDSGSDGAT